PPYVGCLAYGELIVVVQQPYYPMRSAPLNISSQRAILDRSGIFMKFPFEDPAFLPCHFSP
ncbi:MAG: hypothetical protein P9M00_05795, partial [Candidatus Tritonobacter lacicola]|nr:hypothetical protein [Candidatus Tritonobacter lacicola]